MKITVVQGAVSGQATACAVLGYFEGKKGQDLGLSGEQDIIFKRALLCKEFSGAPDQSILLHGHAKAAPERVLIVGLGKEKDFTLDRLRQVTSDAVRQLTQKQLGTFAVGLSLPVVKKETLAARVQAVAEGIFLADYSYDRYLPKERIKEVAKLGTVTLVVDEEDDIAEARTAVASAEAICAGVCFARDLVNAPGNLKSPEYLAMQAVSMCERNGLKARLLDRKQLEKSGFGALLGVAQGSTRDPYLIVMEYFGGEEEAKPVALVGKGVVFDSGGISLKPSDKMDEMKMDMGGAAAVIGTMMAAARLKLPVNLVGVVPAVENMPSGTAIRPGDILTSLSGKTIEVLNTDAEGRLILADALTYVGRYEPKAVIDLATLTGACIIALGNQAAAVLGNDDKLIGQLLKAGERSGERVWQLPLWEGYMSQIKSDFADVKNTGGRPAGTITAAAFLQKFADDYHWAHLDIAGVAWEDRGRAGVPKGGTGFGVRLLIDYLRQDNP